MIIFQPEAKKVIDQALDDFLWDWRKYVTFIPLLVLIALGLRKGATFKRLRNWALH